MNATVPLGLIEFPADDEDRARHFWSGLLDIDFETRAPVMGSQSDDGPPLVGIHPRVDGEAGVVLFFFVDDMEGALARVRELGGQVTREDSRWSYCRDPEGTRFGLAASAPRR
jgi:predicted enzyme related to lactoylglutathione lyase